MLALVIINLVLTILMLILVAVSFYYLSKLILFSVQITRIINDTVKMQQKQMIDNMNNMGDFQ